MRACQRQLAHPGLANRSRLTTMPGKLNIALRPQPASKVPRMYLQRLEIIEHPRFAPCVLDFSKGLNAVLGKNGTGKTTLLKLLVKLTSGDWSTVVEEWHDCTLCFSIGNEECSLLVKYQAKSDTGLLGEGRSIRTSEFRHKWELSASTLTPTGKQAKISIFSDQSSSIEIAGWHFELVGRFPRSAHGVELLYAVEAAAKISAGSTTSETNYLASLIVDVLLRGRWGLRFDEVLGGFKWLTESEQDRMESDMRRTGDWEVTKLPLEPNLLQDIPEWARAASASLKVDHFVDSTWLSELPVLRRVCERIDATRIDAQPTEVRSRTRGEALTRVYNGVRFKISFSGGLSIIDRDLSFGQKRLLAFYWYLACIPEGIVIADELVNGFHHDWIKGCLEEIGSRQAILATQSPLLLDYLGFNDAEQVRRSFVLCSIDDSVEGGRKFKLRNPTEEESQRFMEAYDAGYQQVNEILSAMGMW